ncbi:Txe/YoeB family addiction module toxin [Pantoea agglomerans]
MSKWNIKFTKNGADDLNYWRDTDKKKFERVRQLLHSIEADPLTGIGKPERLRHHKDPALYSRRIDQSHRLVYSIQNGEIIIYAARYHYGDKS